MSVQSKLSEKEKEKKRSSRERSRGICDQGETDKVVESSVRAFWGSAQPDNLTLLELKY